MTEEYLATLSKVTHAILPKVKIKFPFLYWDLRSNLESIDRYRDESAAKIVAGIHIYILAHHIKKLKKNGSNELAEHQEALSQYIKEGLETTS